jgi:hypothetical protein
VNIFADTISYERYTNAGHEFLGHIKEQKIVQEFFRQDGAIRFTSRVFITERTSLFGDCIISNGLWPQIRVFEIGVMVRFLARERDFFSPTRPD